MNDSIPKKLLAFNALLLAVAIFLIFLIFGVLHPPKNIDASPSPVAVAERQLEVDPNSLLAKAAYVYDPSNGTILFDKNARSQLPLASLTKLMTALVATELVPADSHITIRKDFFTGEDSQRPIAGESWHMKDLLDFSLVASSNDAAKSVASVIGAQILGTDNYNMGEKEFVSKMNDESKKLGLEQTYYINESGLDESSTTAGAYGSAADIATLLTHIIKTHPTLLEATKYPTTIISSMDQSHSVHNTDTIVSDIPNLIASKTGYTDLAGGNLAIVFDPSIGRPIIVVVLGSTQAGRFSDVETLVKAVQSYINSTK